MSKLTAAIDLLGDRRPLPESSRDHPLVGDWKDFRDCHLGPDRLLIDCVDGGKLYLARTGSHAELSAK